MQIPDMANQQEEERAGANSELRIITLELMKLAQQRKTTFSKISEEFVSNVYELEDLLAYCASNTTAQPQKNLSKEKL